MPSSRGFSLMQKTSSIDGFFKVEQLMVSSKKALRVTSPSWPQKKPLPVALSTYSVCVVNECLISLSIK